MDTETEDSVWTKKGATLSDKSARKEFGLTQPEIIQAIREGKLQYRTNNVYGNPFFRLVRSEVERLVDGKYAIPQNSLLTKEGSHGYCLYPTKERGAHENPKDIIPHHADDLSM